MWELTFYVIGLAVFLAVMHYIVEPEKLFEDIKKLRGSEQRITSLEQEVKELKQVVETLRKQQRDA